MFRYRVYRSQQDTLLAATDEELIGRSVSRGEVVVHISEQFYGTEVANEGELRALLAECTVANLMGKRCVGLASNLGLVSAKNVIDLDGIPHAQLARMR
ncbi:MAG: DUF424 family protein [Candidatus Thermoplasmatota archaeon]|nr:DUF424 family protein [Candidatus Thermoplasmatota archaeon]